MRKGRGTVQENTEEIHIKELEYSIETVVKEINNLEKEVEKEKSKQRLIQDRIRRGEAKGSEYLLLEEIKWDCCADQESINRKIELVEKLVEKIEIRQSKNK